MATIISTDANGYVTYVNQPDVNRTLLKNIKDTYPEKELTEIFSQIDGEDVSETIEIEAGTNCGAVVLNKAIKHSNVVYLEFTVTPSTRISTSGSVAVTLSGAEVEMGVDWRVIKGATASALFHGYIFSVSDDGATINLKKYGSIWELEETVNFSAIIPVKG